MIQNFTWGVVSSPRNLFPAGLIVDPRTNSLVLNSRTGHVQFYDTHTNNLLYNVSKIKLLLKITEIINYNYQQNIDIYMKEQNHKKNKRKYKIV